MFQDGVKRKIVTFHCFVAIDKSMKTIFFYRINYIYKKVLLLAFLFTFYIHHRARNDGDTCVASWKTE